jgi:hypothetical protein
MGKRTGQVERDGRDHAVEAGSWFLSAMKKIIQLAIGGVLLAMGVVPLVTAVAMSMDVTHDGSLRVPGRVVDLEERSLPGEHTALFCFPVVEFSSAAGRKDRFVSHVGSSPSSYSRGDRVTVRWFPGQSQSARIDSFEATWTASLVPGFFGVVFIAAGAAVIVVGIRRKRSSEDSGRGNLTDQG